MCILRVFAVERISGIESVLPIAKLDICEPLAFVNINALSFLPTPNLEEASPASIPWKLPMKSPVPPPFD